MIRWTPLLDPFAEFDKFFGEGLSGFDRQGMVPAVDVYQTDDAVVVEMPLPGIDPVKADVAIENDVLTVRGDSEKKSEVEEKDYVRREVRRGSFYRAIPLPAHVLGDEASAAYEDGILKVTVPKAKASKAKKLTVEIKKK
jgi:HSP20 family protein